MRVGDLMTKDIVTVGAEETIRKVAQAMAEKNVGMVVVTEGRRCKGIVTDRQIVSRVVGANKDVDNTRVREVMTESPVTCTEDQTVWDAAKLFTGKGPFRRMPVVDAGKNLVGVISIADLALVSHTLIEAVYAETEASVEEVKVEELGLKHELYHEVAPGRSAR